MEARLLDRPEDYKKLGISMEKVEPWEDGKRTEAKRGYTEWWYFDAEMEDGTRIGLNYSTNSPSGEQEDGYHPFVYINIQQPDGQVIQDSIMFGNDDISFGEGICDVRIGTHWAKGNLKNYEIHYDPVNGIGADLKMKSTSSPWRPGTAYFTFGNGDENDKFFTWLCAMPKDEVEGTITVNGETRSVKGQAYHDHQWGSTQHIFVWNHWLWARQHTEDFSILMFDFVARKEYGYKKFPVFCLQDKEGNIIFENTRDVKYEVLEEYVQEASGKTNPKVSRYTFEHDGKKVQYTLSVDDELVFMDHYTSAPAPVKAAYDRLGVKPSYTRYNATGEVVLTEGETVKKSTGKLMYEFSYYANEYRV